MVSAGLLVRSLLQKLGLNIKQRGTVEDVRIDRWGTYYVQFAEDALALVKERLSEQLSVGGAIELSPGMGRWMGKRLSGCGKWN